MLASSVSGNNEVHFEEQTEEQPANIINPGICIPKIEPVFDISFNTNDGFYNDSDEEPLIPFVTPYKLKDPIVVLERCDKIWNTLKLIKNAQKVGYNNNSETTEPKALERDRSPHKENPLSYVQYEPVLGNGNENVPNFKFFVKTKKKVYHCDVCGRQYTQLSSLKHHYCRVHASSQLESTTAGGNISQQLNKESRPTDHSNQIYHKQNNNTFGQSKDKSLEQPNKSKRVESRIRQNEYPNVGLHGQTEQNAGRNGHNKKIIENAAGENGKQYPNTVTKSRRGRDRLLTTGYFKCMLCGTVVQRIKRHMIYYHKIVIDDGSMMNNLVTPIVPEELETELNRNSKALNKGYRKYVENVADTLVERPSSTAVREDKVLTSKKRKSTSDHSDQRKRRINNNVIQAEQLESASSLSVPLEKLQYTCDNCSLAFSTESQLCCHRCSPEKQRAKRNSVSSEQHDPKSCDMIPASDIPSDAMTKLTNVKEKTANTLNDTNDKLQSDNKQENLENICNCGRSFRNVTTLLLHKTNCKSRDETEENLTARSSSDGDSGIGINITIKKKNDSYEIVGRDSGDETAQKDPLEISDYISDCTTEGRNTPKCNDVSVSDTSPYSKDHSILKLQIADEDIVVDIEDEFPDEDSKSNKRDMTDASLHSTNGTEYTGNRNTSQKRLHEKRRKKHICICGTSFATESSLKDHMIDVHPLLLKCGYCKKIFDNITEISDHICSITEGEPYVSFLNVSCCYCNMIFDGKIIEKHIRSEHSLDNVSRLPCYLCFETFLTTKQRGLHIEKEHSRFKCCSTCYKKFSIQRRIRHESYHFGLGFPCHQCKQAFDTHLHYKDHDSSVHRKFSKRK